MKNNSLIVLSGPSGVGKGTIVKRLLQNDGIMLSISCTTRPPREGEVDGKDYFFLSKEKFKCMIDRDELLEYDEHFENFYGTPKDFVYEKLKTHTVLLEIEVNGALNVKKAYPSAVLIMIVPPSVQELKNRLLARGTEDEESIENRMERIEYELSKKSEYDYVVINDNLDEAVKEIENIIANKKGE